MDKTTWLLATTRTSQMIVLKKILHFATNRHVLTAQSPARNPGQVTCGGNRCPDSTPRTRTQTHERPAQCYHQDMYKAQCITYLGWQHILNITNTISECERNMQQANHYYFWGTDYFEVVLLYSEEMRLYACFESTERWCVFNVYHCLAMTVHSSMFWSAEHVN